MLNNVTSKVLKAWYELLNTYFTDVPIFRTQANSDAGNKYIVIRAESESYRSNNNRHVTSIVIITEVVTRFDSFIDDGIACDIDNRIAAYVFTDGPAQHALPPQDDIQIVSVARENATYLPEDDGTFKYFTIVTRNVHRIVQLAEAS